MGWRRPTRWEDGTIKSQKVIAAKVTFWADVQVTSGFIIGGFMRRRHD